MHFEKLNDFLTAIRKFYQQHPEAFVEVKDIPQKLRIGFAMTIGDATWEWTLPLSQFKEAPPKIRDAALKLYKTRTELLQMEDEYIYAVLHGEESE